ncbi:hypothetical protein Hanom_Chr12g01136771 [Helianthus anomalus]
MIYNTFIFYSLKTIFQSCENNHVCSAVRVSAYSSNIFLIFQIFDKIKTYFCFLIFQFLGFLKYCLFMYRQQTNSLFNRRRDQQPLHLVTGCFDSPLIDV